MLTEKPDKTIGADAVLKVLVVRLVQVGRCGRNLSQESQFLLAVAARSFLAVELARFRVVVKVHDRTAYFGKYATTSRSRAGTILSVKVSHDEFAGKTCKTFLAKTSIVRIVNIAVSSIDTKELSIEPHILGAVFIGPVLTNATRVRVSILVRGSRTVAMMQLLAIHGTIYASPTVKAVGVVAAFHLFNLTERTVKAGIALAVHGRIRLVVVPKLVAVSFFGDSHFSQDAVAVLAVRVAVGNSSRLELTVVALIAAGTKAGFS